jgi:hypothetical protein
MAAEPPRLAYNRGMRIWLRCAALASAVALVACGDRKSLPFEPGTGQPDPSATFTRVQSEIFTLSCALSGCHTGAAPTGGMNLEAASAYTSIVGVSSTERSDLRRIAPSQPDNSYLVKKVRGDADISGSRMPLGGAALSASQLTLIVDWVRRGAPHD